MLSEDNLKRFSSDASGIVVLRGTPPDLLSRSHNKQWIVTEEFSTCYAVIAEFRTRDAAIDYVQTISNGGRR